LYHKTFSVKRLEEVRDCYLFSCYTGHGYSDAEALSPEDISIEIDGNHWIMRDRIKTDTTENVLAANRWRLSIRIAATRIAKITTSCCP
jgi:hypothetical protein